MSDNTVLIASRSFGKATPEVFDELRAAGCRLLLNPHEQSPSESDMITLVREAEVIVSGTEALTARVIAAAPRLRGIAKHGVGYENIDLTAARVHNIPVCIAGGTITDSVADMAFALLLALARKIPMGDRMVKSGGWGRVIGVELNEKVLGIVGLGQIGKAVCRRARGFGMRVLAFDAVRDEAFAAQHAVRYAPLEEVLAQADFITLHAPGGPATRNLIDGAALARMKPSAFLINTARGELVDEAALYQALATRRIAGAASDVFVDEPPAADQPLLSLDSFIAAPHSASQTLEGLRAMGQVTRDNVLRLLRREAPLFRVA